MSLHPSFSLGHAFVPTIFRNTEYLQIGCDVLGAWERGTQSFGSVTILPLIDQWLYGCRSNIFYMKTIFSNLKHIDRRKTAEKYVEKKKT